MLFQFSNLAVCGFVKTLSGVFLNLTRLMGTDVMSAGTSQCPSSTAHVVNDPDGFSSSHPVQGTSTIPRHHEPHMRPWNPEQGQLVTQQMQQGFHLASWSCSFASVRTESWSSCSNPILHPVGVVSHVATSQAGGSLSPHQSKDSCQQYQSALRNHHVRESFSSSAFHSQDTGGSSGDIGLFQVSTRICKSG